MEPKNKPGQEAVSQDDDDPCEIDLDALPRADSPEDEYEDGEEWINPLSETDFLDY